MTIEIGSFPIKNGGSFHSYVTICQRVYHHISYQIPLNAIESPLNPIKPPLSHGFPTVQRIFHEINEPTGHPPMERGPMEPGPTCNTKITSPPRTCDGTLPGEFVAL